jgi:hypothetical protein
MKNLNIARLVGCLSILFIINIQQSKALTHLDIGTIIDTNDSELLIDIQEAWVKFQSVNEMEEDVLVEIVDQNFNIIAFGNENDNKIEKLIDKSDLLTEITGKKFFRLCYETE